MNKYFKRWKYDLVHLKPHIIGNLLYPRGLKPEYFNRMEENGTITNGVLSNSYAMKRTWENPKGRY